MGLVPAEVTWRFIRLVADVTADREIIQRALAHSEATSRVKQQMETQVGYVQADRFTKSQKIENYIIQRNEELFRLIMLLCADKGISVSSFRLSTGAKKE